MKRLVVPVMMAAAVPVLLCAQERRLPVPIDYLAGADVYVALGSRDGLAQGDSVPVYFGATGERKGVLLARVVTLRRSVLALGAERFDVAVGDTLWLGIPRLPPPEPAAAARPALDSAGPSGPPVVAVGQLTRRARSARLDGRIGFDLDAIQSDAFEGAGRRYTTPTLRLQAVAAELPGGFRLATNVRLSRRLSSVAGFDPLTSLRIYQAVAEKTFTSVPLRLQAGRFAAALEPNGGYWDGLLARIGGERFGVGAAVGFLPSRANEGFSTDVPRASAFADFHTRGGPVRYDAEVGVHALRPRVALADQTFVGLAQRLRWQGLFISQSVQVDRTADARWLLSGAQVNASVALAPGLAARAGGSRHREADPGEVAPLPSFHRDRGYFGVSYFGAVLGASTDVSVSRLLDGRTLRSWTAFLQVPRALAVVDLSGTATLSRGAGMNNSYLAAEMGRGIGPALARLGLHTTHYRGLLTDARSTGADATFTLPLAGRAGATVRLESWWGSAGGARQRLLTSIWTGF